MSACIKTNFEVFENIETVYGGLKMQAGFEQIVAIMDALMEPLGAAAPERHHFIVDYKTTDMDYHRELTA